MCGVIVVDAKCFCLLDTDMMPMFMIIALDVVITMRFSINCSAVICSPTVIFPILREATSETYGPRVSFPLHCISFPYCWISFIILQSLLSNLYNKNTKNIYFIIYLSLSDLTFASDREGIDNPFIALGASCWLFVQVFGDLCVSPTGLIPWFSKLREILMLLCCMTLSSSWQNQRKLKR